MDTDGLDCPLKLSQWLGVVNCCSLSSLCMCVIVGVIVHDYHTQLMRSKLSWT